MSRIDFSTAPLESELLRSFEAVARHGNVTHAANQLHKTQSALSLQIKRLEARLGVTLFRRRARGMELTTEGEALLRPAQDILARLERTAAAFREAPLGGRLSLGVPDEFGAPLLTDILARFRDRHPQVELTVRCGFSSGFPEALEKGDLYLAVVASDSSAAESTLLRREKTLWVAARDYVLDLEQPLPLVMFDRDCWWRDLAFQSLEAANLSYRVVFTSESTTGITAAVSAGLGVGLLAEEICGETLRILGPSDGLPALPPSNLCLLLRDGHKSPAAGAMADAIRSALAR